MNTGIYIHIPYCARKCRYCDFVSAPVRGGDVEVAAYFDRLRSDIGKTGAAYGDQIAVDSVFFGGGTPSLVDHGYLCDLLEIIGNSFYVNGSCEISLEANPGTLTAEKLAAYRAAGFNRISIGVQSLNDEVLKVMGRIHDSKEALRSYETARRYFDNINLDLMMGVPAQTPEIWLDTLEKAIALDPRHLSFYSLQLEEGTPFCNDYRKGLLQLPSWEENRRMYHEGLELIKEAGFIHYEISNAAKPGFECRHNMKYWTMEPYLGFGAAAHSFIGGRRFEDGEIPILPEDELPLAEKNSQSFVNLPEDLIDDLKGDFVFTQLRLIEGLDKGLYRRLFGSVFRDDYREALESLVKDGLLEETESKVLFTSRGLDKTNPVMERLL